MSMTMIVMMMIILIHCVDYDDDDNDSDDYDDNKLTYIDIDSMYGTSVFIPVCAIPESMRLTAS